MNDPIVEEVRRIRDAHAARFDYDLDAIFRDIKEQEVRSGHKFVGGEAQPPEIGSAMPLIDSPTDDSHRLTTPD